MKKILQFISAPLIAATLLLVPSAASAQDIPTVEVGSSQTTPTTTSSTPTTTSTTTAGVPETGIAPAPSKAVQYVGTFAIGGSIGALVGLGIVSLKKRSAAQL